jgi:hypothetical protein
LRKAAARRLAEAGCTAHEIGAITGHTSLAELVRYTKAADQRRLAETAMAKTRTSTRKPAGRFAKKGEKVLEIKRRMTDLIQNDSGLAQGLAGRPCDRLKAED